MICVCFKKLYSDITAKLIEINRTVFGTSLSPTNEQPICFYNLPMSKITRRIAKEESREKSSNGAMRELVTTQEQQLDDFKSPTPRKRKSLRIEQDNES
jgi:hypothetical protein